MFNKQCFFKHSFFSFVDHVESHILMQLQTVPASSTNEGGNVPSFSIEFVEKQVAFGKFGFRDVNKRSTKNKSSVWNTIKQVMDENQNDLKGFFCCETCKKIIKNESQSGTTTPFIRHVCAIGKGQTSIMQFASSLNSENTMKCIEISERHQKELRESCVQFICSDLRPYSAVEGKGLYEIFRAGVTIGQAYPLITESDMQRILPSRGIMQREIENKTVAAKKMLKIKLQIAFNSFGGFSCTADLWTDKFRQKTYLSITAHVNVLYDAEIKHERYVIWLDEVNEQSKTKEVVDNHILSALACYGFSADDVKSSIYFVTDRGSQFKTTDKYSRASCWGHLLNNVVEKICNDSEVKNIISDAAKLVRYIKKAGLNYRFSLSLKSYCDTRWSTVYNMLQSIVSNFDTIYKVLEQRQSQDRRYNDGLKYIETLHKSTLIEITNLLHPFKVWTDFIEADLSVTIHKVWPIYNKANEHLKINCENDEAINQSKNFIIVEGMKACGREYIRQIEGDFKPTMEQLMAIALHPRFKKLKKMDSDTREKVYEYLSTLIANSPQQSGNDVIKRRKKTNNLFDDFADSDDNDSDQHPNQYSKELNEYLNTVSPEEDLRNDENSIALLKWWFNHQFVFPQLFKIFMRISSIPASSAPSERCFSITGQIITDRRSCLLPKNVSNIMMCRNLYMN